MKAQMFVDWAKIHYFIMIAIVSAIILCGALLLGYLGPNSRDGVVTFAYNCPDASTQPCAGGVQLGVYIIYLQLFFSLKFIFFNCKESKYHLS